LCDYIYSVEYYKICSRNDLDQIEDTDDDEWLEDVRFGNIPTTVSGVLDCKLSIIPRQTLLFLLFVS
jgi:hypothetical protein